MKNSKNSVILVALNHAINYPRPYSFNYFNGYGILLIVCLVSQILSGVFLAIHYVPTGDLAFMSVEHIMRDLNYGWFIRYTHANGSSMFFLCAYIHIARGLYYGSYVKPRHFVWITGCVIFILMMAQKHFYSLAVEKRTNIKIPLRNQYIRVFYSEMSRILNYHFIIISYNDHIYFDNNFFVLYCYFGLIIYGPLARIYHIYSVYGYDNFKDFIYKYFYDKLITPNFILLPIYFFLWFCKNFLFKSQQNEQNEKKEKNKKNE